MNKTAKIILNVLILILISIIIFLVLRNFLLDKKLKDEINKTYNLIIMDDYNYKDVYEKIDNIVTKEGYAIVEDSAKDYLLDYFLEVLNLDETYEKANIENIISIENIKKDGKKFKNSKETLSSLKESIENIEEEILNNLNKEKMISYINDKNLADSYIELYESLDFMKDKNIEKRKSQIEDKVNSYLSKINKIEEVIDFLIKNNNWKVENEQVKYEDEQLSIEYNEMINSIYEETNN